MAFIIDVPAEKNLYLALGDIPALGVLPSDVTCRYHKAGQTTLTAKVIDTTNWFELGNGFYTLRFTAAEMDTQGSFFYLLSSSKFDNLLYDEFTIEPPGGGGSTPVAPPGFCTVSGSLLTVGSTIPVGTQVTFRPANFPISVNSSVVTADKVVTYPDINGNFQVNLIQGCTVIVEIERTGLRAQIVVPSTPTANLLDLLSPFPAL